MSDYRHAIDKAAIPTVRILGVNIAAINMDWLLRFTEEHVKELSGDYICVSNVHTTVTGYRDEGYRAVQNGGILAIPDGGPLSTEGRKRGAKDMGRTTGPDYMEEILKMSASHGWRHYFYGAKTETLDKLRTALESKYPEVTIVGMHSPPYRPLTEVEDQRVINEINSLSPDFIWVGLGAPKQERWMAAHQGRAKGLMVGVGAAFDYAAGNIRRAPEWMQRMNLEWLFRLFQEPRRLLKRYVITNTAFIWNAVVRGK